MPPAIKQKVWESETQIRQAWLDNTIRYVGIMEKTNKNDHDSIYRINAFAKSGKYSPYCAAGLYYTAAQTGLHFKLRCPACVRSWFEDPGVVIWDRTRGRRFTQQPKMMDVIWIFSSHIEALATVTIPRDIEDDDQVVTIAFNTSSGGKQGVFFPLRRRWRDVRRVANHVGPYVSKNKLIRDEESRH